MLTACPYRDCAHSFDLTTDEHFDPARPVKNNCPNCRRPASFRSIDILEKCQKQELRIGKDDLNVLATDNFCAVLEDIRSLWNVGSIYRTADGAGIKRLFLSGITGCPPRQEIAKTSLGAENTIAWHYSHNAAKALEYLKTKGAFILALERNQQSQDLSEFLTHVKIGRPLCLVVGNEVTGLSQEALWLSDSVCHLPMRGMKESLNVAVAFGIAAYSIAEALPRLL